MAEIQTSFGVVKINCYGEVTVDKTVWNRMATAIFDTSVSNGQLLFCVLSLLAVQLEDSFDQSILNENPMVPQSSLAFYLERLTKEDNLAAVLIVNGMTISLVGQNNNIIVMDSHLHGQLGAMVGIISVDKVEELLSIFVKQQLSPPFNICSLPFVSY